MEEKLIGNKGYVMKKEKLTKINTIINKIGVSGGYLNKKDLRELINNAKEDIKNAEYLIEECSKIIKNLNDTNRKTYIDDAYFIRGLIYEITQNYKLAIKDFTVAVNMYSDANGALFERGKVYFLTKEYEHALNDLNRVIDRDSNSNGDYYYYRGLTYKALGDNAQATKDLQQALQMAKNK